MPKRELERLQAVHRFLNLEIDTDKEMQEIVQLAADLCETPTALITLIDDDTQYFKVKLGTDMMQNQRKNDFCNYVIQQQEVMVIPDALEDDRFSKNPSVVENPHMRFYAGAPLTTHDGHNLGSICVFDVKPRQLTDAQTHLLKVLSKRVIQIMEFDLSLNIVKEQFLDAQGSEIKLKSFFESSVACHLLFNQQQVIQSFNKNMANFIERIYHVKLRAGVSAAEILQGEALERFNLDFNRALQGEPVKFEREVDYGTEKIWWYVTLEPGYNDEGEIIGISYNCTDITERKQAEEKILTQNESLKQVAHMQSHDLRRPVASILGFMEIFKHDNYQATKEDLQMMEKAVIELDGVIRTIVRLSDNVG